MIIKFWVKNNNWLFIYFFLKMFKLRSNKFKRGVLIFFSSKGYFLYYK
jgi:hypothetical protein